MLPFTIEVYFSTISQYNAAIWPASLIGYPAAMLLLAMTIVPPGREPLRGATRVAGAVLALAWLVSGIGFHLMHFSAINFLAPFYALAFVIEAGMLAWVLAGRQGAVFRFVPDATHVFAILLMSASVTAWPLVGLLIGGGFVDLPMFGTEPTATVLMTLGVLLMADRPPLKLAVLPVLWTYVDGATFLALGQPAGLVFPVLGTAAFFAMAFRIRRASA